MCMDQYHATPEGRQFSALPQGMPSMTQECRQGITVLAQVVMSYPYWDGHLCLCARAAPC